jgi:hypothetical protein
MVNVDFIWPPSEVILTPTPMAVVTQLMVKSERARTLDKGSIIFKYYDFEWLLYLQKKK